MGKKVSCPVLFSLILISVIMGYFIYLAPYTTDNYVFSLDLHPGYAAFIADQAVSAEPLTFSSAFRQAKDMYFTWCGRYMGNLVVYLMFLLPHWLYSILASILFGFYILLLQMLVFGRKWRENLKPALLFILAGLVWIGVPSFGEAFLWLSVGGQFALLGQALAFLPCRFALDAPLKIRNPFYEILACMELFMAGCLIASLDYPTSAVMPVTCLACAIWIWLAAPENKRRIPWLILSETFGLSIGGLFTLMAPGNTARLALTNQTSVILYLNSSWGERILFWLRQLPDSIVTMWVSYLLLLISILALYNLYGRAFLKHVPYAAYLFLLPAVLTYGAYLFTAWPPTRAFATVSMQLIICAAIILFQNMGGLSLLAKRLLILAFSIYCGVYLLYEGQLFMRIHLFILEREKILVAHKGDIAELPPLPDFVRADRYMLLGHNWREIETDPEYWINRAIALHYGVKEVRLHPEIAVKNYNKFLSVPEKSFQDIHTEAIDRKLRASTPLAEDSPKILHYYYHGSPGILAWFPQFIANWILKWLENAKYGDLRLNLVPILFARSDISLKPDNKGHLIGDSINLSLASRNHFWLVKPGKSKFSFDVLPLKVIPKNEED